MKKTALITSNLGHPNTDYLMRALRKHTEARLVDIQDLRIAAFPNKWNIFRPGLRLSSLDTVFFRACQTPLVLFDFKLMVAEHLESMGVGVINSSTATRTCRNKFSAIQMLQRHDVPTPKTRLALKPNAAMRSIRKMKKPVIIKLLSGSQGRGVMKISSNDEAESVIDALWVLGEMIYFQEYVETRGKDIRAFVIGDEVVAAMERTAKPGDFRSNISSGGKGVKIELDSKLEKLALKASKVVGTEIAGVDIVLDGKPKVLEVNSNPGLGIRRICKVDIADRIARYIAEK